MFYKKSEVEKCIGKKVLIVLFNGETIKGFLRKTGEEEFKNEPNLYYMKNRYFITRNSCDTTSISVLFRSSHIKKMKILD